MAPMPTQSFPYQLTDQQWREQLAPEPYAAVRRRGTEMPDSCALLHETRAGVFSCAGCGQPLFESKLKFESGTGWPSFTVPIEGAVAESVDRSHVMVRTEVHC